MKPLVNLKDLLLEQLRDLYDGERQQLEAFPKFLQQVSSEKLRQSLEKNLMETQQHLLRLDTVFIELNEDPKGEENEVIEELIEKIFKIIKKSADHEVLEAGLINYVQFINHFEIAGYGSVCAFAKTLGYLNIANLLHETLEEEKSIDKELTTLAEESINRSAKSSIIL